MHSPSLIRTDGAALCLRRFLQPWLLAFCAALAGCSLDAWIGMVASPEEQARARSQVDHLRARDFDAIEGALRADLRTPELRPALEKMAAMVPAGEPRSVQIIGASRNRNAGVSSLTLSFEYEFASGWMLASVTTETRDGAAVMSAFHVVPSTRSLADEYRFDLAGKSALHYGVLAAAVAAVALTLYALYLCVRTKGLAYKALWMVFILFGFGRLAIEWSSGAWGFNLLHLQLLGASYMAPLGAPPVLSASLPVGAIVFLARRWNGALPMKKGAAGGGRPAEVTDDPAGAVRPSPPRD